MCVCVCIYMYTHTHTHFVCVYIYTIMYIYTHTHTHTHTRTSMQYIVVLLSFVVPHRFLNLENLRVSQPVFFAGYVTRVFCTLSVFTNLVTMSQ